MAFTLPTFNLAVRIWHANSNPWAGPPDVITIGNLAWGRRVHPGSDSGGNEPAFSHMILLLPSGTDIRDFSNYGPDITDYVEVPGGSGRFYQVGTVDDIGKGFPNEHRAAQLRKYWVWPTHPWPAPIP